MLWVLPVLAAGRLSLPLRSMQDAVSPSTNLTNLADVESMQTFYYTTFSIGTPPQDFSLLINTQALVNCTQLPAVGSRHCHGCSGKCFDPQKSSTFRSSDERVFFETVIGNYSGTIANDAFNLPAVVYEPSQDFVLVNDSRFIMDFPLDGIMVLCTQGLGYCNHTQSTCNTVTNSLYSQSLIDSRTFSIYFSDNNVTDKDTEPRSNLMFGGTDMGLYGQSEDQEFGYVYLVENAESWTVDLLSVSAEGIDLDLSARTVTFSTQQMLMIVNNRDYTTLLATITQNGHCGKFPNYLINCDCEDLGRDYPTLTFQFSGYELEVPPSAYFFTVTASQSEGQCILVIAASGDNSPTMTFGTMFLKELYLQYDYDNSRIGVSRAKRSSVIVAKGKGKKLQWWGWLLLVFLILSFIVCLGMLRKVLRSRHSSKPPASQPMLQLAVDTGASL